MTNKKSNKALRAALVLCVLALFCAAFVGATFAKYVTADDASDTARAAKWGIAVSIGGKLFGEHYNANSAASDQDKVAVSSDNVASNGTGTLNIVAPGTKSDKGIIIDLKGTPEVEYIVNSTGSADDIYLGVGTWAVMVPAQEVTEDNFDTYIADADFGSAELNAYDVLYKKTAAGYEKATAWEADTPYYELHDLCVITADTDPETEDKYYPIAWTVEKTGEDATYAIANGRDLVVITAALVDAIDLDTADDLDEGISGIANNALAANYKLTWEWAFDGQNNAADTILGNLMQEDAGVADVVILDGTTFVEPVADTNFNLDLAFDINVTVTQVN